MERFDRGEKIAVAALILASIAFIAAGNPQVKELHREQVNPVKVDLEEPDRESVPNIPRDLLCTDNVQRDFLSVYTVNESGYCYYSKIQRMSYVKLVFYGFETPPVLVDGGEKR